MRKINKKVAAVLAGGAVAVAGGGVAFAYFTDSGSGNGAATVGTSSNFTVDGFSQTGTIYPGASSTTVSYTITNGGSGDQHINAIAVTVAANAAGDVLTNANDLTTGVTGCKASWFSVDDRNKGALATLASGDHEAGSVVVSMPTATTTNQDACKNAAPAVHVAVS